MKTRMRIAPRHLVRLALTVALVVAFGVGALASAAAGSAGHAKPRARIARCAQVDFKPQSDDVAFNITTVGATCATGRTVVQGASPESLRPGPNRSYRSGEFACRGTFMKPLGKWYEHYVCRSSRARVVFDRG